MGTNRQTVCAGFKYNHDFHEGPVWIASQNAFFFSNFEHFSANAAASNFNGDIIKYTPSTGQCEIFITNVGTNGLGVAPDGNLLATSHLTRSITEFDLVTKQPKIILDSYMGHKLNSPNDIIVHSNGTIYFSNPDYELGNRTKEMPTSVIRIDPLGAASLVAMGGEPNGVTLSADERRLYVEQDPPSGTGVKVYDLDLNGVPTAGPRDFTGSTDGMTMDCAGNLYLSGAGTIVGPDGKTVGTIPGGGATMPTFGGADGKTLLVLGGQNMATGTMVATVQMNVPGLP
jgi:gluconolactonase